MHESLQLLRQYGAEIQNSLSEEEEFSVEPAADNSNINQEAGQWGVAIKRHSSKNVQVLEVPYFILHRCNR
jgi:hypothetical protein